MRFPTLTVIIVAFALQNELAHGHKHNHADSGADGDTYENDTVNDSSWGDTSKGDLDQRFMLNGRRTSSSSSLRGQHFDNSNQITRRLSSRNPGENNNNNVKNRRLNKKKHMMKRNNNDDDYVYINNQATQDDGKSDDPTYSYDDEQRFHDEIVKARLDFRNGGFDVPKRQWPIIDNTTCFDDGTANAGVEFFLRRAPYFLILGAMKAGTSTMNSYLKQHTSVVSKTRSKEFHFFDIRYTKNGFDTSNVGGIDRNRVRNSLYHQIKGKWIQRPKEFTQSTDLITFDDSPRYLFWSDRIPPRVMCVTPWVKLIAIVREPVSRAFSHYNMELKGSYKHGGPNEFELSFADWIQNDLQDLIRTGVLQEEIPLDQFIGSKQQQDAWKAYTRLGTHAPLGRGLYVIQLNQWLEEMKKAGKTTDDLHVINSERFKNEPDSVYRETLQFLDLPDEPLKNTTVKNAGEYRVQLSDDLRNTLKELYAPFNHQLYKLLGTNWDGVWET